MTVSPYLQRGFILAVEGSSDWGLILLTGSSYLRLRAHTCDCEFILPTEGSSTGGSYSRLEVHTRDQAFS